MLHRLEGGITFTTSSNQAAYKLRQHYIEIRLGTYTKSCLELQGSL